MADNEFELIGRHFSTFGRGPGVLLGVGDDAALLAVEAGEALVTSVDTLVEGVHFPAAAFPEDIGYRAVAVAASDLAAMGARPLAMTLALTIPQADDFWLHAFSEGVGQASRAFSLPLVGGDTTRGPCVISVSVFGCVPSGQALLRSGARPGDEVCISGTLGDAAAALAIIDERWRPADPDLGERLLARFYRPTPRLALGQSLLGVATSAIDISDGLLADLGHVAAASGVAMVIESARLPLTAGLEAQAGRESVSAWALSGGDDYELCFTVPAGTATPPHCTRIGSVVPGSGVSCDAPVPAKSGYSHF